MLWERFSFVRFLNENIQDIINLYFNSFSLQLCEKIRHKVYLRWLNVVCPLLVLNSYQPSHQKKIYIRHWRGSIDHFISSRIIINFFARILLTSLKKTGCKFSELYFSYICTRKLSKFANVPHHASTEDRKENPIRSLPPFSITSGMHFNCLKVNVHVRIRRRLKMAAWKCEGFGRSGAHLETSVGSHITLRRISR